MFDLLLSYCFFFFNDTATTEIYTLSLHDALPICDLPAVLAFHHQPDAGRRLEGHVLRQVARQADVGGLAQRSEEHTSELQSRQYLVCRLLLEKKKKNLTIATYS